MGLFTNSNYWIDLNQNPGVHVHARRTSNGRKVVDKTFGEVRIIETGEIYNQKVANQERVRQLESGELAQKIHSGKIIRPDIVVETDKIKNADSFAIIACTPSIVLEIEKKKLEFIGILTKRVLLSKILQRKK